MKPIAKMMAWMLVGLVGISGCGLLDSEATVTIDVPDQTFTFSLDASQVRAQIEQACSCTLQGDEIPAGVNLTQTFSIEIPAQAIDLTQNPDLQKYKNQLDKVKSVTIKYVRYNLSQNSLNFDLPAAELWIGELSATSISHSSAKKIAVLPSIAAGFTGSGEVSFVTGGRDTLSSFLLSLQFALLGKADINVDTSKTRTVPGGQLAGSVTVGVSFKVAPL